MIHLPRGGTFFYFEQRYHIDEQDPEKGSGTYLHSRISLPWMTSSSLQCLHQSNGRANPLSPAIKDASFQILSGPCLKREAG